MTSLGSLVVSLAMDTASFTSDIGKAAQQMGRLQAEATKLGARLGGALGAAAVSAWGYVKAADMVAQTIGDYQDLADVMGDTAEAAASLQMAADLSGTSLSEVAAASVKMTAALAKTDEEAKGVGAGLAAIGLRVEEFKRLSPTEQIEAVAKALGKYKEGAEQTAVATAIFGKAGAQLLPFLKDLADEGGRQIRLTQQQIEVADAYAKAQARTRSQLAALGQSIVADTLPAVSELSKALLGTASALTGIDVSGREIQRTGFVREFARDSAVALAVVLESAIGVARAVRAIGGSFQVVGADLSFLKTVAGASASDLGQAIKSGTGVVAQAWAERQKVVAEANARYVALWNYSGTQISDAVRKALSAETQAFARFQSDRKELAKRGRLVVKPEIDISGLLTDSDTAAKKAAAEAARIAEAYRSMTESVGEAAAAAQREIDNWSTLTPLQQMQIKLQDELTSGKTKFTAAQRASIQAQIDGLGVLDQEVQKNRTMLELVRQRADFKARDYQAAEDAARANEQADRDRLRSMVGNTREGRLDAAMRDVSFLNTMLDKGSISVDAWADAVRNATAGLGDTLQTDSDRIAKFAETAAQNFQSFLGQGLYDIAKGNFSNIASAFGDMVLRMATEAAAADLSKALFGNLLSGGSGEGMLSGLFRNIGGWFTGGASGPTATVPGSNLFGSMLSTIGGFFSGSNANGGYIPPGKWGWVGENGPEPAFGGRHGMSVSPAGAGAAPVYHINVQAVPGMSRATALQQGAQIGLGIQRAMARST